MDMQTTLLMNAVSIMFSSVFLFLEEKGIVDTAAYAALLDQTAAAMKRDLARTMPKQFPMDAAMLGLTAHLLRQNRNRGWSPVVIQGGLSGGGAAGRDS